MRYRSPDEFDLPAVMFVNGFGDQLMSLPAMRALASIFPGGMQLLLGEGMLSFFYRGLPFGDPVRLWWDDFEKKSIDVERSFPCARPCDLFLSLSTWASPSILELARRMGAGWTVGHGAMFDHAVPLDASAHMFDLIFSVTQALRPDLRFDDFSHAPRFSPAAENAAARFVRKHAGAGKRILFVHPETHVSKMWSPTCLQWVLGRFLDAYPDFVVFVASVSWFPLLLPRGWDRLVLIDEHLELVLAILRHADLFLGVDSCFLHAADLYRIPGIGLFGPTEPERWGFRLSPRARSIWGKGSMKGIERAPVLDCLLETAADRAQTPQSADSECNDPARLQLTTTTNH